jgi:RimJ/RimL family protein N-acetyltransferase
LANHIVCIGSAFIHRRLCAPKYPICIDCVLRFLLLDVFREWGVVLSVGRWRKGVLVCVVKLFRSALVNIQFAFNNWTTLRNGHEIQPAEINGFFYRGMRRGDEQQLAAIYFKLNGRAKFSWSRRWLYRLLGSKLMLVATKHGPQGEIVIGMNMYYINKRDKEEGTVHEGFVGVLPAVQGLGIATALRQVAKHHFSTNGFKGISTRISVDNLPSLKSAHQLAFRPIEEYYDEASNVPRYYMICDFKNDAQL